VNTLRDEAIVVRTYKLAESDRICVLFTRAHGKVRAVAHGVRKTSSRLGGRMEVLDVVDVQLARGRSELMTVRQAQPLAASSGLRAEFSRLSAAMVLVEVADAVTLEHLADPEYYDMTTRALRAIETAEDPSVVVTAFLLKTLAHDGAAPVLDRCASCGATGELVAFDLTEGGLLCPSCRRGRPVSAAGIALLRRMLLGGLAGVLAEGRPEAAGEVASIAVEAMEAHVGKRLRAARVVDTL
jgi:DNA repair protein RecO (recombination protein O)